MNISQLTERYLALSGKGYFSQAVADLLVLLRDEGLDADYFANYLGFPEPGKLTRPGEASGWAQSDWRDWAKENNFEELRDATHGNLYKHRVLKGWVINASRTECSEWRASMNGMACTRRELYSLLERMIGDFIRLIRGIVLRSDLGVSTGELERYAGLVNLPKEKRSLGIFLVQFSDRGTEEINQVLDAFTPRTGDTTKDTDLTHAFVVQSENELFSSFVTKKSTQELTERGMKLYRQICKESGRSFVDVCVESGTMQDTAKALHEYMLSLYKFHDAEILIPRKMYLSSSVVARLENTLQYVRELARSEKEADRKAKLLKRAEREIGEATKANDTLTEYRDKLKTLFDGNVDEFRKLVGGVTQVSQLLGKLGDELSHFPVVESDTAKMKELQERALIAELQAKEAEERYAKLDTVHSETRAEYELLRSEIGPLRAYKQTMEVRIPKIMTLAEEIGKRTNPNMGLLELTTALQVIKDSANKVKELLPVVKVGAPV